MANEEGQERLERAVEQAGLPLTFSENSTKADIAVQVWMADPALFVQKLNEQRLVDVLHFRPTKDDVVVYSPVRDEIRIHTGTKGERELYQETFGVRLFGDDKYFSERKAYTLEPLRTDALDALDTDGLPGISRV